MIDDRSRPLVYSVKELCRVCYTCVRECPAKAIRMINGQADVIQERCIACGNCVRVCSQKAKRFRNSNDAVKEYLESDHTVVAIIAPSFPAEYMGRLDDHTEMVGMISALGFDYVNEVAFGADLVALKYKEAFEGNDAQTISSDCPGIVNFIKKYHPGLTKNLAPIVSPMVATARILRKKWGEDIKVVFIGPCIAKKDESSEIEVVITFKELEELFEEKNITPKNTESRCFDEPKGARGAIFPISRGLIQSIDLEDDIIKGNIIVADGRRNFEEAIKEFESGFLTQHLELLCCEGCILGAGMTNTQNRYAKMSFIKNYVNSKDVKGEVWLNAIEEYKDVDLSTSFIAMDSRIKNPAKEEIEEVLKRMGKNDPKDYLNCTACGYETCEEHAIAIIKGLAEEEMCLPYTIEKLHRSVLDLNTSNEKLESAQQALKQSEKLAGMGQLSAGIAHELNNPLGVVIMYANILLDEVEDTDDPIYDDLKLIVEQTARCKAIVGGLLNFARKNQVRNNDINLRDLAQKSISSIIVPAKVNASVEIDTKNLVAEMDEEQMMQVLTNLNKNAIEAMPEGGELKVSVKEKDDQVVFEVSDTGEGIAKENIDKIFEPFFTTKGIGKGTGLGLATSYGIIKMHKGKLEVESNNDPEKGPTGTRFIISIPREI